MDNNFEWIDWSATLVYWLCVSFLQVCVCVWLKVVLFVLLFAFIEKPTREIEGRPSLFVFFLLLVDDFFGKIICAILRHIGMRVVVVVWTISSNVGKLKFQFNYFRRLFLYKNEITLSAFARVNGPSQLLFLFVHSREKWNDEWELLAHEGYYRRRTTRVHIFPLHTRIEIDNINIFQRDRSLFLSLYVRT